MRARLDEDGVIWFEGVTATERDWLQLLPRDAEEAAMEWLEVPQEDADHWREFVLPDVQTVQDEAVEVVRLAVAAMVAGWVNQTPAGAEDTGGTGQLPLAAAAWDGWSLVLNRARLGISQRLGKPEQDGAAEFALRLAMALRYRFFSQLFDFLVGQIAQRDFGDEDDPLALDLAAAEWAGAEESDDDEAESGYRQTVRELLEGSNDLDDLDFDELLSADGDDDDWDEDDEWDESEDEDGDNAGDGDKTGENPPEDGGGRGPVS